MVSIVRAIFLSVLYFGLSARADLLKQSAHITGSDFKDGKSYRYDASLKVYRKFYGFYQVLGVKKITDLSNGSSEGESWFSDMFPQMIDGNTYWSESDCLKQGFKIEEVTVAAGTFRTCKTINPKNNCIEWMGAVPFYTVKFYCKDPIIGERKLELVEYTN